MHLDCTESAPRLYRKCTETAPRLNLKGHNRFSVLIAQPIPAIAQAVNQPFEKSFLVVERYSTVGGGGLNS